MKRPEGTSEFYRYRSQETWKLELWKRRGMNMIESNDSDVCRYVQNSFGYTHTRRRILAVSHIPRLPSR